MREGRTLKKEDITSGKVIATEANRSGEAQRDVTSKGKLQTSWVENGGGGGGGV